MTLFRNQLKKYVVQGYSLVEILMVLGLFSGIATLSLGALFNAQSVNTKLLETQTILDNMNLSLQTVRRAMRSRHQ
jgi:type II secretory pathway pseudopilin PulG